MAGYPPGSSGFQPNPDIRQRIQEDPLEMYFLDPYKYTPEKVDFVDISKLNVSHSRTLWRQGIMKIEQAFS